ncbi:MAG: hypothetical protein ACOC9Q_03080 [bacterium]
MPSDLYANGMARLSELVATTAGALNLEEPTVSVCARHLRETGLIKQKGRGPSAAQMGPTDASNLLLGLMASDALQHAPENVRRARKITFSSTLVNDTLEKEKPQFPFLLAGDTLGDALDTMFDELGRYGMVLTTHVPPNLSASVVKGDLTFHVQRPGNICWFEIDDGDEMYEVSFTGPPWQVGDGVLSDRHGGMKTVTEVRLESLGEIADALNLRDVGGTE